MKKKVHKKMACNTQILREFDVFATKSDNDFELSRTCNDLAHPFEQFCLIPPASRLALTNTCRPFMDNTLDPSYIFPQTTQGLITTLEDLPIVYVSFPAMDSKDIWIRDDAEMSPNTILNFEQMTYRGFRPVSQAQFLLGAAASSVSSQVFCILSNSATIAEDAVELFKADQYGLFRTQIDDKGFPIRMRYSTIPLQGMPVVLCNEDGSIQCACVNNQAYVFNAQNTTWTTLNFPGVVTVAVWQDTVLVFLQSSVVFYLPSPQKNLNMIGVFAWQCLSADRKYLFVCMKQNTQRTLVYTFDLHARTQLAVAECNLNASLDSQVYFSAITVQNTSANATILVARGMDFPLLRFSLTNSFTVASQDIPNPLRFVTAFYNNTAWFEDGFVFRVGFSQSIPAPPGMTFQNCLGPTENEMWSFVKGKLMRWSLENPTVWTNEFDLYMAYGAHMSDENSLVWHFPPSIDPPWYYGFLNSTVPESLNLPLQYAQSRHNRYRWIFDSVETNNNTQFAHLDTHLERINDFYLLTDRKFVTRVFDDANITVTDRSDSKVFETNTHDQASNPQAFELFVPTRPVGTKNGLYLMYVNTQNNARQVVLCYNVFNSSQFADWCSNQTDEFISRALQQQSSFCFSNLMYEDENGTQQFADRRCDCVPSLGMFELRFPDAFANMSSYIASRTIQNIPCLSQKCADIFLLGQENSNVLNYAQKQCKQNLVLCSNTALAQGNLDMKTFSLLQDCGTENRCTNNAQCPANSICFNGNCIQKCTTDQSCKKNLQDPLASCQTSTGRCLYGTQAQTNTSAKWYWIAGASVAIVVAIILLIVLLALYV